MKSNFLQPVLDGWRRSLPARLSVWIVIFAAAIFVAALGYLFQESRKVVREEVVERATQVLNNTVLRVNNILDDVELASNNVQWLIYRNLSDPDAMFDLARNALLNNPQLNGCSISFEPYFYRKKGLYFSTYASHEDGSVVVEQEGSDDYAYFYTDWYLQPKLLNQPCWTEPYMDVDFNTGTAEMITSYCVPLIGNDGNFIGTLTMDISLQWLSETVSAMQPYPNSYSMMVGRGGTFLIHPDPDKLLKQTIFTHTMEVDDPDLAELGHAMLKGEAGMRTIEIDGVLNTVFFEPVKATGWSVAIVCPRADLFRGYERLRQIVLAIVTLGLLLMLVVCSRVVSFELDPLRRLALQADEIATGRFDMELPKTRRIDEIGQLSRSFGNMQTSLVKYIDELTEATAHRERIEGEVRIARDIQMGMVPRTFPPFPTHKDIDLYASMTPAREVGGDLYDFFLSGDKLYFCIGDVSGKGVPASLLMAVVRNLFHVVGQQEASPANIAWQLNEAISADNEQMMFVTMFIGVVDLVSG